jgi:NAD(P)-dependent dehydrogenase (short-subunit alcohol dehydrogenase family)
MENKSKIALVTGGSRGLGKDMALRLAEKGIDVILTYNTKKEEALGVVAEIEKAGRKAAAMQLDTGRVAGFDAFVESLGGVLKNKFGADRFDFLINNAGVGGHALIGELTEALFDTLVNVHFKGTIFLTQKTLPIMNDGGGIINLSTGLTRITIPGVSVYAGVKAAIESSSRILAAELGPRRIRVNIVAPGAIQTDFSGGIVRDNPEVNKRVTAATALGRPGLPEDIGGVVAFLCTDDARWINAQRIEVSGGQSL